MKNERAMKILAALLGRYVEPQVAEAAHLLLEATVQDQSSPRSIWATRKLIEGPPPSPDWLPRNIVAADIVSCEDISELNILLRYIRGLTRYGAVVSKFSAALMVLLHFKKDWSYRDDFEAGVEISSSIVASMLLGGNDVKVDAFLEPWDLKAPKEVIAYLSFVTGEITRDERDGRQSFLLEVLSKIKTSNHAVQPYNMYCAWLNQVSHRLLGKLTSDQLQAFTCGQLCAK